MAIEVKIPPMGESITSGVLAKWHVKNGDLVKKDQPEAQDQALDEDRESERSGCCQCHGAPSLPAQAYVDKLISLMLMKRI